MIDKNKEYNSEAVVHHVHYNKSSEAFKRTVSINGAVYSISLSSDDPQENIEYISGKSMKILKELIKEGK